jgi:hypothetical protein
MNLDFEKLLKLALPTFLRRGLGNLVKAIAAVFTAIYNDYRAWQTDMRLEAAMTCQNMYIEAMLNYRLLGTFDRIITLEDGTGIPVDFIVKIPDDVQVDTARLVGLVNKYKTYGKRYLIVQGMYTYEIAWLNPVCEQVDRTYITGWREPVCEQVDRTYITEWREPVCELKELIDNWIRFNNNPNGSWDVSSQYPVASDVGVVVKFHSYGTYYEHTFIIPTGATISTSFMSEDPVDSAELLSILPEFDDTYYYYELI